MRKTLLSLLLAAIMLAAVSSACGCIYFGPERQRDTDVTASPEATAVTTALPSPAAKPTEVPEFFTFYNRTDEYIRLFVIPSTNANWGYPTAELMRGASSEIGFDEFGGLPGRYFHVGVLLAGERAEFHSFYSVVLAADNTVEFIEENGEYYVVVHRTDGAVQRYPEYVYD